MTCIELIGLKEYIEKVETQIDSEWGSCRSAKQLIEEDDMPEEYAIVLKELERFND